MEELHHLVRVLRPEFRGIQAKESSVHPLVARAPGSHSTDSSAHGRAEATRVSRRRTSAVATSRPVPVSR